MMHTGIKMKMRKTERGAALITAVVFSAILASFVGASLLVNRSSEELAYNQSRSESAVLLADAGASDEISYIAQNMSTNTWSTPTSYPASAYPSNGSAYTGLTYPGDSHTVYGRPYYIANWQNPTPGTQYYYGWVYDTNDAAGTTAWDGHTSPFYITATSYADGEWKRVQVEANAQSLFNNYGLVTDGGGSTFTSGSGTTVTVSGGVIATNGNNCPTHCKGTSCYNANGCSTFTSSNCNGGTLQSSAAPICLPTTCTMLKRYQGNTTSTDTQAWNTLSNNCSNNTGCYTFNSGVNQTLANCTNANTSPCHNSCTTLDYSYTGCFQGCKTHSGTTTCILEPGDYYFTSANLAADGQHQIILDPQATCSGGTPGQIRIWICNPNLPANPWPWNTPSPDLIQIPLQCSSTDPSNCRVYYGNDSCTGACLKLDTTNSNNLVCGGVYAVTKPCSVTSNTLKGACVDFNCPSTGSTACITGCCITDTVSTDSTCKNLNLNFGASTNPTFDIASGCYAVNYSCKN